jgi:hypothetical protein
MSKETTQHFRLLTAAARMVLQPIGMIQKGRSRIWLDDHGWWVCVVEFQPSYWSRGSYLNVGCMWLWQAKDHISFDEGHRVEQFSEFHNEEQFEAVAKSLAQEAAREVLRYRRLFPSVHDVCAHYSSHQPEGIWPTFNVATSCALAGKPERAQRLFERIIDSRGDDRAWVVNVQAQASSLCAIAENTQRFRDVITETIHYARDLQKLPRLPPWHSSRQRRGPRETTGHIVGETAVGCPGAYTNHHARLQ